MGEILKVFATVFIGYIVYKGSVFFGAPELLAILLGVAFMVGLIYLTERSGNKTMKR